MSIHEATRPRCPQCQRALRSCVCALAQTVEHQACLLILMHPQEVREAKGTAHLLHLCLPHSQVLTGEEFDAATLQQALHGGGRQSLLLYPQTTEQERALGLAAAAPLPSPWPCDPATLQLVVMDGTWRKSRKMLYLNPPLQALPRMALQNVPPSQYAIRKAHLPGQLSTFEASVQALAQLEGWVAESPALQSMNRTFAAFVQQQMLRQAQAASFRSSTSGHSSP